MSNFADRPYGLHHKRVTGRGIFTNGEFAALCAFYGDKCLRCGASDKPLHADHVIALARGGMNTIGNIQPLCKSCNSRKHAKDTDYRPAHMMFCPSENALADPSTLTAPKRYGIAINPEMMSDFLAIVEREGRTHKKQVQQWVKRDKQENAAWWAERERQTRQQSE